MSKRRIQQFYEHFDGDVYISFSGGKDSTVLLHLARQMYPDIRAMFVDTGLEYPEIKEFVKKQKNVEIIRPKMSFKEVIEKWGYPVPSKEQAQFIHEYRVTESEYMKQLRWNGNKWGRGNIANKWKPLVDAPFKVSHYCCDIMKKNPSKEFEKLRGLKPILGTLAEESSLREQKYIREGCNSFEGRRPNSTPLAFWTEQDILEYIHTNFIEIAEVYGGVIKGETYHTMGLDRTGCVFCMFGIAQKDKVNRFKKLQETHPQLHKYCMKDLGIGKVLDYINIDGGQND